MHHYRHLVLLQLTDEGADHPAGLNGAVVPVGLPDLLPPGHGDVRARLLKYPKSMSLLILYRDINPWADSLEPDWSGGRIVFGLRRTITNYCTRDIHH